MPDGSGGKKVEHDNGIGDATHSLPLKKYFNLDGKSGSWTYKPKERARKVGNSAASREKRGLPRRSSQGLRLHHTGHNVKTPKTIALTLADTGNQLLRRVFEGSQNGHQMLTGRNFRCKASFSTVQNALERGHTSLSNRLRIIIN